MITKIYVFIAHTLYYSLTALSIRIKYPGMRVEKKDFNVNDFLKHIKGTSPTIIEVGAHDGSTTNEFLKCFPTSVIFAFEPGARAATDFKKNVMSSNVFFENIALSDINKINVDFYESYGKPPEINQIQKPYNLSSSILEPRLHKLITPWVKFKKSHKVETKTLDRWIVNKNIKQIDLLWIDAQGAELKIFKGAQTTLKKVKYIYFEYSFFSLYKNQGKLRDIMKLLSDFEIIQIFKNDILLGNKKVRY